MWYLRNIVARVRAWFSSKVGPEPRTSNPFLLVSLSASIHRDVTPHGVRVYSLCGGCGARLEISATLCDSCARSRQRT